MKALVAEMQKIEEYSRLAVNELKELVRNFEAPQSFENSVTFQTHPHLFEFQTKHSMPKLEQC